MSTYPASNPVAVPLGSGTRLAFSLLGTGLLGVFLAGLVYLGTTPVETLTLAVVFCGGMSMLFTP